MPFRDAILPLSQSRTLIQISGFAMLMGVYSLIPVWKEHSSFRDLGDIPSQFHAALSLILGWLLVFRTNSAYARWWEARTLWGTLINAIRNFSAKATTAIQGKPNSKEELGHIRNHLVQFPRTLKVHLRGELPIALENERDASNAISPTLHVQALYAWLWRAKHRGELDGDELRVLDVDLVKLLEVCGGCERIARTPIVQSYRIFARQCVMLFLLTLPWGIANDFGWWTVPLSVITAYFMIGLEIVAEHVEEPFGLDEDDLDLEGMCQTIERSVNEIFERTLQ